MERNTFVERARYLTEACSEDIALRAEVESLLSQSGERLDSWADSGGFVGADSALRNEGRRINAYELIRELGRGGMGTVWLARRADGEFEKQVAIKLLKRGTETDEVLRRFRSERQILARLDHPNIARLLDAGTTDDGLPFFVMEYVAGEPVTDYVQKHALSVPERLRLFTAICSAIEFAHQQGIVHRDLKPANILVSENAQPKLLDFGVAKILAVGDGDANLTLARERRISLGCASPEQARGEAITAATDVYALGALLYEMLAGRSAHQFSTPYPTPVEQKEVICEREPIRPSVAAHDTTIQDALRGDLDNIVLKAIRKAPAQRYASAADFAEDVSRHLARKPVQARRRTAGYVARRFIARHKVQLAGAVVLCVIATLLGVIVSVRARDADQLQAKRSTEKARIANAPTADPIAYQLYLRGRDLIVNAHINQIKTLVPEGIGLLQQAIARDADFLLAHCYLALGHDTMFWSGVDRTAARRDLAEAEVRAAERLQPESGETRQARGQHLYWGYADYAGARAEFEAAGKSMPNDPGLLIKIALLDRRLGRLDQSAAEMEQALANDPRNTADFRQLALTYQKLHAYGKVETTCDRILALNPNDAHFRAAKAAVPFERNGDTQEVNAILPVLLSWDTTEAPQISALAIDVALCEKNSELATAGLKAAPESGFIDRTGCIYPRGWFEGLIARSQGDGARAEEAFLRARVEAEKRVRETADNAKALSVLGLIDAMLGRKEQALGEGRRAAELLPVEKDAMDGPEMISNLALICALLHENDLALGYLTTAISLPTYTLTYGRLKLHPLWQNLRGDSRFENIVASAAPHNE